MIKNIFLKKSDRIFEYFPELCRVCWPAIRDWLNNAVSGWDNRRQRIRWKSYWQRKVIAVVDISKTASIVAIYTTGPAVRRLSNCKYRNLRNYTCSNNHFPLGIVPENGKPFSAARGSEIFVLATAVLLKFNIWIWRWKRRAVCWERTKI